jgi:hypothetical protein
LRIKKDIGEEYNPVASETQFTTTTGGIDPDAKRDMIN